MSATCLSFSLLGSLSAPSVLITASSGSLPTDTLPPSEPHGPALIPPTVPITASLFRLSSRFSSVPHFRYLGCSGAPFVKTIKAVLQTQYALGVLSLLLDPTCVHALWFMTTLLSILNTNCAATNSTYKICCHGPRGRDHRAPAQVPSIFPYWSSKWF